jgi:hypothetical protein
VNNLIKKGFVHPLDAEAGDKTSILNVDWLGLLSVARLGGQCAWDAKELLLPISLT